MAYNFNADEIFEMAEQIERNGANFYQSAADNISDDDKKEFLIKLANMEKQHEKSFAQLRKELSEKDKEKTVFDPDNESAAYLKALADIRVFYKKEIDTSNIEEILKEAIIAEKDSIVFYLGMKDLLPKSNADKIDLIIKEEMKHVTALSNKLATLKK